MAASYLLPSLIRRSRWRERSSGSEPMQMFSVVKTLMRRLYGFKMTICDVSRELMTCLGASLVNDVVLVLPGSSMKLKVFCGVGLVVLDDGVRGGDFLIRERLERAMLLKRSSFRTF